MHWLSDLAHFLAFPFLMAILAVVLYRSNMPKRYKIIRESNPLGEERFEVWFDYPSSPLIQRTWILKETFDTEKAAEDYILRHQIERKTVSEGPL